MKLVTEMKREIKYLEIRYSQMIKTLNCMRIWKAEYSLITLDQELLMH